MAMTPALAASKPDPSVTDTEEGITACRTDLPLAIEEVETTDGAQSYTQATYRVRRGDTLTKIAKKYRTSRNYLASKNRISRYKRPRPGSRIRVPRYTKYTYVYYSKRTRSLSYIAKKYRTSTKRLARINRISQRSRPRAGTHILVPRYTNYYISKVKSGQSLKWYAYRYRTSVTQLAKLNQISTKTKLRSGQPLLRPRVKPRIAQAKTPTVKLTYKQVIARSLAKYGCKGQPFTVGSTRGSAWGLTSLGSGKMTFIPGMRGGALDYVVAHECAHNKQVRLWKGETRRMIETYNRIYRTSGYMGLEYNADCATRVQGLKYQGYTTNCGGERGAAAVALNCMRKP